VPLICCVQRLTAPGNSGKYAARRNYGHGSNPLTSPGSKSTHNCKPPPQLSALYLWLRRSQLGLKLVDAGPRLQGLLRGLYGRQPSTGQTLVQLRESLTTLHSQAAQQHAKPASALRPLNPVHEKDFP